MCNLRKAVCNKRMNAVRGTARDQAAHEHRIIGLNPKLISEDSNHKYHIIFAHSGNILYN